MKSLIKISLIGLAVFSLCSFSENQRSPLKSLPENPTDVVEDSDKPQLSCADLPQALEEYNHLARANEVAFADFTLEVTAVMFDWHNQLRPLEGSSGTLRQGTFDPIYKGAEQIDGIVGMVYENSDQLASRMDVIIKTLKTCL